MLIFINLLVALLGLTILCGLPLYTYWFYCSSQSGALSKKYSNLSKSYECPLQAFEYVMRNRHFNFSFISLASAIATMPFLVIFDSRSDYTLGDLFTWDLATSDTFRETLILTVFPLSGFLTLITYGLCLNKLEQKYPFENKLDTKSFKSILKRFWHITCWFWTFSAIAAVFLYENHNG